MTAKLDLSELNKEQRAAVMSKSQRLLILAGAGSGKTKVLTSRIAYLLLERKASPESIVGLTFTNKAAGEMRHRIAQFVDAKTAESLTLSTFHSFCMKILRQEIHHLGFTSHFTLYDEQDMNRMMRLIARVHPNSLRKDASGHARL
ncbi:MAG: pcrA-A [Chlamydiales bacterium]|nr:pcrA-A [Chlamydiales bacterium]